MTDFYRIRRLPPYVFAEVNAMKAAARARGEDVVDLGMGNPDGAPPAHVIEKLAEAHVAVSPGVGFGEEGEGLVRIALVENEQRIRQAARGVKRFLE